ncbi:hypothetical protein [Roseiarcus sp.]|uniref:hypothetical protein n=1 Tax=Roseiarcus sp. TaxID=1969460 RepID=UPI003F9D3678
MRPSIDCGAPKDFWSKGWPSRSSKTSFFYAQNGRKNDRAFNRRVAEQVERDRRKDPRAKLILEASLTNVIADPICAHMNQRMGAAVDRFVLEPARTIASASHKI